MSGTLPFPLVSPGMGGNIIPPDIFANQLRMAVSFTDVTLVFGVSDTSGPSGEGVSNPVVRDRVAVHMAPGMLKQLLMHVQMAVDAYESALGVIPVPAISAEAVESNRRGLTSSLREQLTGVLSAPKAS